MKAVGQRRAAGSGTRQRVGRRGEQAASAFLELAGWTGFGRNLRTPYGEIDLLARVGETLVFVDVKSRRNDAFGMPETGMTARKQTHLAAARPRLTCRNTLRNRVIGAST